jgi:hypothetical protein
VINRDSSDINVMNTTDDVPYAQHVVISSYIYIFLYTIFTFLNVLFIYLRRKHQPVQIRSPEFIIFHLVAMWGIIIPCVVRQITGKSTFPCFYYVIIYCFSVPMVIVPHVIRMYRFVLIFRLSHLQLRKDTEMNVDKRIKVIKVLTSSPVLWFITFFILFIHAIIWAVMSVVLTHTENIDYFGLSGCKVTKYTYLTLSFNLIYAVLLIFLLILLIKGVKDTYGIRYETFGTMILWVIVSIVFVVYAAVPPFSPQVESNFPAGTFMFVAYVIDVIITSVIPIALSYRKVYTQYYKVDMDEITQILHKDLDRAPFKEYAIRSVCAENICKLVKV